MNKKVRKAVTIALAVIMLLCLMPTTTVFASIVMSAEIKNIYLPVICEKPDFSAESSIAL